MSDHTPGPWEAGRFTHVVEYYGTEQGVWAEARAAVAKARGNQETAQAESPGRSGEEG